RALPAKRRHSGGPGHGLPARVFGSRRSGGPTPRGRVQSRRPPRPDSSSGRGGYLSRQRRSLDSGRQRRHRGGVAARDAGGRTGASRKCSWAPLLWRLFLNGIEKLEVFGQVGRDIGALEEQNGEAGIGEIVVAGPAVAAIQLVAERLGAPNVPVALSNG